MRIERSTVVRMAARILLANDPSAIVDDSAEATTQLLEAVLDKVLAAVAGKPLVSWPGVLEGVVTDEVLEPLVEQITSARLRAAALGADDSQLELEADEVEAPDAFSLRPPDAFTRGGIAWRLKTEPGAGKRVGGHVDPVRSWPEVVEEFLSRGAITRDAWDLLAAEEMAAAFTVAGQASASMVRRLQVLIARALEEGRSAETAVRWIQAIAPDMARSHAETVYRNAVQSAYARGRAEHMVQPHVVAARPYWQTLGVRDERTRKTHRAVSGWVMLASDAGWQATYPPYGHRCRCRVVARSAAWVERMSPTIHSGALPNLPDRGWVTRSPPAVAA